MVIKDKGILSAWIGGHYTVEPGYLLQVDKMALFEGQLGVFLTNTKKLHCIEAQSWCLFLLKNVAYNLAQVLCKKSLGLPNTMVSSQRRFDLFRLIKMAGVTLMRFYILFPTSHYLLRPGFLSKLAEDALHLEI